MYPWRFYLDQLIHFVLAKSRHGTHSPFVYRLVDELIYPKRRMGEPRHKVLRLTERLIKQFGPQQIYYTDAAKLPEGRLDFVVTHGSDAGRISDNLTQLWPQLHVDSVLVVEGIYRNAGMKRLWQSIQTKAEVTVTVDLLRVGLVFFHLGQAKEHFRIRY